MHRSIFVLWDTSYIWGLMVLHTLQGMGVPHSVVSCNEITHGALSGKPALLLVPGGTASLKYQALGDAGCEAIRQFVADGGNYLGFCGGAGFGLSHDHGLNLCPWGRATYSDRMQHLVSGHMLCKVTEHSLSPHMPSLSLPIWWPGRFAPETERTEHKDGAVHVLAKYHKPGQDFSFADIDISSLPPATFDQWQDVYGVNMRVDFLQDQPCVIAGNYGKGRYVLSYSHLETPNSPEANAWLAKLLQELGQVQPQQNISPEWHLDKLPQHWELTAETALLFAARDGVKKLLTLGKEHHLLFQRKPWLCGWRTGIPGGALNNLYTTLCTILSLPPSPEALSFWQEHKNVFSKLLPPFLLGVEGYLLAERLATTLSVPMPHAINRNLLKKQQEMLFGTVMHSGGAHKELLQLADALLFILLQGQK